MAGKSCAAGNLRGFAGTPLLVLGSFAKAALRVEALVREVDGDVPDADREADIGCPPSCAPLGHFRSRPRK
eukprot:1019117-Prorocentrum_lima.AAC.1